MSSTGTKRIIENYIQHGGNVMNEDDFQVYKLAILTKWLDALQCFDSTRVRNKGPELIFYSCPDESCDSSKWLTVDEAVAHLKIHKPEWFIL